MFLLVGCNSVQQEAAPVAATRPGALSVAPEIQRVAEAVLGNQAEVVAHGDLARNGLEQLLETRHAGVSAREIPRRYLSRARQSWRKTAASGPRCCAAMSI
jgi:hypothetical protein